LERSRVNARFVRTFAASNSAMVVNATDAIPAATLFAGLRLAHFAMRSTGVGGRARIGSFERCRRRSAASSAIVG